MNREIKFRSFYNNKSMLSSESYINLYYFFELKPEQFPLMQYTGLKDKNGVEIYEGDILEHKDPKGYSSEKWEVIFYSGSFFMAGLPNKIRIYNIGDRLNITQVIGNIHEHPELLNTN